MLCRRYYNMALIHYWGIRMVTKVHYLTQLVCSSWSLPSLFWRMNDRRSHSGYMFIELSARTRLANLLLHVTFQLKILHVLAAMGILWKWYRVHRFYLNGVTVCKKRNFQKWSFWGFFHDNFYLFLSRKAQVAASLLQTCCKLRSSSRYQDPGIFSSTLVYYRFLEEDWVFWGV